MLLLFQNCHPTSGCIVFDGIMRIPVPNGRNGSRGSAWRLVSTLSAFCYRVDLSCLCQEAPVLRGEFPPFAGDRELR